MLPSKVLYYEDLYNKAVEIATAAHEGQTRWGGEPYITHPLAVAEAFPIGDAKIVAVLHDVLEDSDVTVKDLAGVFPMKIVDACAVMTHQPGQTYADYIMSIRENKLATTVKLADITHNLSDLTDDKHKQRRDKYQLAIKLLELR